MFSGELSAEERAGLERLRRDAPLYAETCLKIVDKAANLVPFKYKLAQRKLWQTLVEQREAGKPMRVVVLKARQVGISTMSQGLLIQRCTLYNNHSALVVAHDLETGGKLYDIGHRMYNHLPGEPGSSPIKPATRGYHRSRMMHFANKGEPGTPVYPDSRYLVNTANEPEAGRGGTYHSMHLSEVAFWADIERKMRNLLQAVPDRPDTLIVVESTANGHNAFKDFWDDAEAGRNDFIPFFFPWHEEPEYVRPFNSERERNTFRPGDTSQSPYAEGEQELLREYDLSLEQLNWRRYTIANKLSGSIEGFQQEYPASPEEAFIATGRRVFDSKRVKGILVSTRLTDPTSNDPETPAACKRAIFTAKNRITRVGPTGDTVYVPEGIEVEYNVPFGQQPFKLWLPDPPKDRHYVIGVDVASGIMPEGNKEPDYSTIQVIDHQSREQVAEYKAHIEPLPLADLVYMAAKHFNDAWVAVEVTGSHGLPTARRLYFDYGYPFMYVRRSHDSRAERMENRIGWSTDVRTKPILEATAEELLRLENHGIRSRALAEEMLTYVRNERGKTGAEPGKHDDLLIAWMIAQQVANELQPKIVQRQTQAFVPVNPVTGY